jgi:hypothetical protein
LGLSTLFFIILLTVDNSLLIVNSPVNKLLNGQRKALPYPNITPHPRHLRTLFNTKKAQGSSPCAYFYPFFS